MEQHHEPSDHQSRMLHASDVFPSSWFRFSTRSLLIACAVCCVVLAIFANSHNKYLALAWCLPLVIVFFRSYRRPHWLRTFLRVLVATVVFWPLFALGTFQEVDELIASGAMDHDPMYDGVGDRAGALFLGGIIGFFYTAPMAYVALMICWVNRVCSVRSGPKPVRAAPRSTSPKDAPQSIHPPI